MNQVFLTKKTLTFKEADPAGIMFFGNIFGIAHDAFEEFIVAAGYSYREWFGQTEHIIPIRHTDANYLAPFFPGQTYQIAVTVAKIGETSFQMKYVFSQDNRNHAIVTMTHAVANKKTMQKAPLPEVIRARLQPYVETTSQGS
jgi:acyl-CoA thioester hydrolase/1,4-dihydroxy-2-naphthoyl-CoA hydrolase